MKILSKKIIITFLASGLVYAILMEGFYHFYKGQVFDVWRFLLSFSIFGFFMSLSTYYRYKKQLRNVQKEGKNKQ